MNKCNFDLTKIKSKIKTLNAMYIVKKWDLNTVINRFIKLIEDTIPQNIALDSPSIVSNEIYGTLSQSIISLNENFFTQQNIFNIITGVNQGLVTSNNFQFSAEQASKKEAEQVYLRKDVNSEFLDNAYGMVTEARKYATNVANQNLFDTLFINRGSVQNIGPSKTILDINKNIKEYQEQLLRKIVQYLNTVVTDDMHPSEDVKKALANPRLYIDGKNSGILTVLRPYIDSYLSRQAFTSLSDPTNNALDGLRSLYNIANNPNDSKREQSKLRLDAYNAAVLLQNFDKYIITTLRDLVDVQDVGILTGKDNKYAIGKKLAKILSTWANSDNRDVEGETDFITKLAISTTPLYNWQVDNSPVDGKFLTFADFQYIIGKLKELASWNKQFITGVIAKKAITGAIQTPSYWNQLHEETRKVIEEMVRVNNSPITLSNIINVMRRNPRKYLSVIFDLLSNSDLHTALNINSQIFEEGDLNVIYSLNKGVFGANSSNSLYNLSILDGDNDFYSFITQVADTVFNVSYLQYYRDSDGNLQVRTFISQNLNNIRRTIETSINASNNTNTIKDFDSYSKQLNIQDFTGNSLKYTIPNTDITISVNATGFFEVKENGQKVTSLDGYYNNPDVLRFLDQKLRLGLENSIDLQKALKNTFQSGSSMSSLLSFVSRIILNQNIIHSKIDNIKNIENRQKEAEANNIKYNKQLDIVEVISSQDIPTLYRITNAKASVMGITTATQTKDGEGNGQSMQTQSRLLGSHWAQFELQEKLSTSATRDCIILNVPGLYEGVYTSKEYYSAYEGSKAFEDMDVSEFVQASFVYDYIGGLEKRVNEGGDIDENAIVGNGHVMFIPSVNSDKNTIGRIKIDLNQRVATKDGTIKAIRELNTVELKWLISKELGNIYINMYEAINKDWTALNNFISETLGIQGCPNLGIDYLHNFREFNAWWYKNQNLLSEFGKNPTEFIRNVTLRHNQLHFLDPIVLIDQTHFKVQDQTIFINGSSVKIKKALAHNPVLISQIARFNPDYLTSRNVDISVYPDADYFWANKQREVLKSLIKSRFQINTTNKTQSELRTLRENYPEWINASGDVVLAKATFNGKVINITSSRDLFKFRTSDSQTDAQIIDSLENFELHPAIQSWNYLSYLFTQEFMNCTVGSFINHPEKSKDWTQEEIKKRGRLETPQERVLRREAAHFQAQHKRNVSFTAAMHEFQLNLLNGIPEDYNIAVIEDIKDFQGTISGDINEIKPFDGATFVNPFIVLLENYALGGARAGITKKQFVHFKNERTGTGGIIKTCGFGLTNDWIRNSTLLQKMMQKMTNHVWVNRNGSQAVVNILKDFKDKENNISYDDMYFEQNGRVYEIVRIESLGNNQYRRVLQEIAVDNEGNPQKNVRIGEELVADRNGNLFINSTCDDTWVRNNTNIVNNNYELWKLFGADHSMSAEGKYLSYSNSSVENVVKAMNRVASENGGTINRNAKTQDDLWQPLKQSDIHYVATAGAVKQGAANINSASRYTDDVAYDALRIKMYQAGIQLDKEHHADDAELSLMTQVISACAAKGYTFVAASRLYDALRKSTEIGTKQHLDAVTQYITSDDPSAVQEVMYKAIIDALGTSNSTSFAYIVAQDLIRQAKENKKIKFSEAALPLSDKTVRGKIFSAVSIYLTNSGIKQKIPGILSVLTPSFNIFKIHAGRKLEAYKNPREDLAIEQAKLDAVPVFDVDNSTTNASDIELGRTYKVTRYKDIDFNLPNSEGISLESAYRKVIYDRLYNSPYVTPQIKSLITKIQNNNSDKSLKDVVDKITSLITNTEDQKILRSELIRIINEPLKDFEFKYLQSVLGKYTSVQNVQSILFGNRKKLIESLKRYSLDGFVDTLISAASRYSQNIDISNREGNTIITYELINTPIDYRKLKDEIIANTVTKVVETVIDENGDPLGRDLAAYNVRYTTTDGHSFQLYDLDSVQASFRINELLKDDTISPEDKAQELAEISQNILGKVVSDPNELLKLVNRVKQKDMANLSRSVPSVIPQYEELLRSRETYQAEPIQYQWSTIAPNSYEVSSAGDKHYSYATFKPGTIIDGVDVSGMTIENVYQSVIKKSSKGQAPSKDSKLYNPSLRTEQEREDFSYREGYLPLWQEWARQNPEAIEALRKAAEDKVLTDKFAKTRVSQARALADILTETQKIGNNSWYDRYAQWVNIYLGTGNGSEIEIPKGRIYDKVRVTAENFDDIEPKIRALINRTTQVKINGQLYTVDKNSLKVQPYELILPKIFATKFGLKPNVDLQEITSNPNYFIEQYTRNNQPKINDNNFSIALKTSTGNHTYLISKNQLDTIDGNFYKVDKENIGLRSIDGNTVRLDSKGNIMYEVSDDFELWIDDKGNEVIATDNFEFYLNNTSFESIQFSSILKDRLIIFENVLSQIHKSTNKVAKYFYRFINYREKQRNFEDTFNRSVIYDDVNKNPKLLKSLREKHTSFLKSLYVVAARIPSQSMQSFMPMKVVAFDNPDINTAHVSTLQILLQGSDYRFYTVVK